MSHNKEAVPRDADLGTVGKHFLRRSTSNPYCEAVGNDAGLWTVEKHGLRSSTSNLSASPRSGGAGPPPRPLAPAGLAPSQDPVSPHRSVLAERKAWADTLQALLYRHPDKLSDFQSSVGGDFKPYRLLADVKFRDILTTFEGHPDVSGRDKLCKMAVSLHKRWYEKSSNTTKSKSNNIFNNCSDKRKDHSFDTGNTSSTAAQPGNKIPRKGQSPATPQVTASNPPLPAAPIFDKGEEIEIHQPPKEDELLKTLSISMFFADAASSTMNVKAKVNREFILFIKTGGEERLGISWHLMMSMVFEDILIPKIDWSNHVRGIGVLAAVNEES